MESQKEQQRREAELEYLAGVKEKWEQLDEAKRKEIERRQQELEQQMQREEQVCPCSHTDALVDGSLRFYPPCSRAPLVLGT